MRCVRCEADHDVIRGNKKNKKNKKGRGNASNAMCTDEEMWTSGRSGWMDGWTTVDVTCWFRLMYRTPVRFVPFLFFFLFFSLGNEAEPDYPQQQQK